MSSHEPQPPAYSPRGQGQPTGDPSAYAPPGHPQPGYGQPGYAQSGYEQPGYAQPAADPGKGVGIAGFVLAFLGPLAPIGVILSIVGVVQSRRVRRTNGLAIAGIVIGVLVTAFLVLVTLALVGVWQTCQDLGPGEHFVNGVTYTCS